MLFVLVARVDVQNGPRRSTRYTVLNIIVRSRLPVCQCPRNVTVEYQFQQFVCCYFFTDRVSGEGNPTGTFPSVRLAISTVYFHCHRSLSPYSHTFIIGIPSPTHSFTLGLNHSFSANPPYRSLSFVSFKIHYMDFPDCLLLLLSISVFLLFSFFPVFTLF